MEALFMCRESNSVCGEIHDVSILDVKQDKEDDTDLEWVREQEDIKRQERQNELYQQLTELNLKFKNHLGYWFTKSQLTSLNLDSLDLYPVMYRSGDISWLRNQYINLRDILLKKT
jgi:hypothetical protein